MRYTQRKFPRTPTRQQTALEHLQSEAEHLDLTLVTGDYGAGFEGGDHAVEPLRLCLLRFLRGNAFSVSNALSQVLASFLTLTQRCYVVRCSPEHYCKCMILYNRLVAFGDARHSDARAYVMIVHLSIRQATLLTPELRL